MISDCVEEFILSVTMRDVNSMILKTLCLSQQKQARHQVLKVSVQFLFLEIW